MKELENYINRDPDFAKELILSLIKGYLEFRESFLLSIRKQEPKIFFAAHHKMKVAFGLTGDKRFEEQADIIQSMLSHGNISKLDLSMQNSFCKLCTSSIRDLEETLKRSSNHISPDRDATYQT